MNLEAMVSTARKRRASDLHLESGRPAVLRINGELEVLDDPSRGTWLVDEMRRVLGNQGWNDFLETRSHDLSRNIAGVRCRLNVFKTNRGMAVAIRLLSSFQASLGRLNLHPDLVDFVQARSGLVLFSGPTGCGKSTTMAALIEELNRRHRRHVLTIEHPIEYAFTPKRAMIRQREVPVDTPSFRQGLLDALREDPDLIMVGEMREPDTMRLVLNAAETGHLVFATVHSGNVVEAVQRLVTAFPADRQRSVQSQLADCLNGVICQRLSYRPELGFRVAELEIMRSTTPVRSLIRSGALNKIRDAIQTGAAEGMYSFERYRRWLDSKEVWSRPMELQAQAKADDALPSEQRAADPALAAPKKKRVRARVRGAAPAEDATGRIDIGNPGGLSGGRAADGRIDIGGADDLGSILAELEGS